MAQRVTQQLVQVAFDTNPEARVTAVAVEVLQAPPSVDARVTAIAVEVLQSVAGTPLVVGGARTTVYIIAS